MRIRGKIEKGEKVISDELFLRNKMIRRKYERSKIRREERKDYFGRIGGERQGGGGSGKNALDR